MEGNVEQVTESHLEKKVAVTAKKNVTDKKSKEQKNKPKDREKVTVNLQSLLQAGAHFGHQTTRWSPAMAPYIYTSRNGIHIINLPLTMQSWEAAKVAIHNIVSKGGNVLFVGTKKQAQEAIAEEANRCGAFYVTKRWLGGMITNFQTIKKSIERMNKVESILAEEEALIAAGETPKYKKKERLMMSREREKLDFSLGGIREMHGAPQLMFVIDIKREDIAIKEAKKLDIPVVALVDTNCDPRNVNYAIPSNDDGTRVIRLFCAAVADTVIEAKKNYEQTHKENKKRGSQQAQAETKTDTATKAEEVTTTETESKELS